MANDIFGGSGAIEGVFGISTGSTITFSNGGDLKLGFLIDTYNIQWGRSVTMKRVLNMAGRIAIVGAGQGTLTLQGIIGAADQFSSLIEATSGNKICENMTCTINAGSGFGVCSGGKSTNVSGQASIVCSGLMLANINTSGQISDNNVLTMGANLTFQMSGLNINKAS